LLCRFHVSNENGKPKIPEWIKPVNIEPRGEGFEILVDEKAKNYLDKRRYAIRLSLPKSYISVSQVKTYLRCPLQYYFSQIEGLKLPPKSALAFGSVTHKSVEVNYKQKLDSHEDLPVEHIQEV
jgi:ATP-dependent helicase/DNAse subunit B